MAKLKAVIENPHQVPGQLRDYYVMGTDGKQYLSVDGEPPGYVSKATHDEFRTNNRALNGKVTDLETKLKAFEGIDPATVTATASKLADLEQKFADVDPDEYRALKARPDLTPRVTALEADLATETAAKTKAQQSADTAVFRSKVGDVFIRVGGRPQALDFIIAAAEKLFTLKDGQLTTKAFSADKPGEALTVDEWIGQQTTAVAFAFAPSSGGGAGNKAGAGRTDNSGKRIVSADPLEFGRNIEDIAKGKAVVQ
jgi:hypothetical protein